MLSFDVQKILFFANDFHSLSLRKTFFPHIKFFFTTAVLNVTRHFYFSVLRCTIVFWKLRHKSILLSSPYQMLRNIYRIRTIYIALMKINPDRLSRDGLLKQFPDKATEINLIPNFPVEHKVAAFASFLFLLVFCLDNITTKGNYSLRMQRFQIKLYSTDYFKLLQK